MANAAETGGQSIQVGQSFPAVGGFRDAFIREHHFARDIGRRVYGVVSGPDHLYFRAELRATYYLGAMSALEFRPIGRGPWTRRQDIDDPVWGEHSDRLNAAILSGRVKVYMTPVGDHRGYRPERDTRISLGRRGTPITIPLRREVIAWHRSQSTFLRYQYRLPKTHPGMLSALQ